MRSFRLLYIAILTITLFACQEEKTTTNEPQEKPKKEKVVIPSFNQDSAYQFVADQVTFGSRVNNSKAHDECAKYLVNKLKSYGCEVIEQDGTVKAYDGQMLQFKNIIGQINPELGTRIFISAHWDSRHIADQDISKKNEPILGANDGASGVGVILELARVLQKNNPGIGVDFFLWDAEDHGNPGTPDSYCLGSQYWTKNIVPTGYLAKYGINLDMVGAKDATFPFEGYSYYYAADLCHRVWSIAAKLGYESYFPKVNTSAVTDDHFYVSANANIPCIDIIHKEPTSERFHESWHTHADDMSVIDKETLKAVGQTLLAVIFTENN